MAYQSRALTFYANTSYLGLVNQGLYIEVAGSDATALVDMASFRIELNARVPAIVEFNIPKASAAQVKPGHSIRVLNGGSAGALLFSGHCVQRQIVTSGEHRETTDVVYGMDLSWLLDRYQFVTARYENAPITAIVTDLLTNADPNSGFVPGLIEPTVSLTIEFNELRISDCVRRLAAASSSVPLVTPSKEVSLLSTVGSTWAVGASAGDLHDLEVEDDITQARTRVIVHGEGSSLAATYASGASTMTLTDATWASSSGGSASLNNVTFTYTGVSGDALPGVSGAPDGFPNDDVHLVAQADDASAQTIVASLLGGSQSGIITFVIHDDDLSEDETTARASDELISGSLGGVRSITFKTRNRTLRPGQLVSFTSTQIGPNRFLTETVQIDAVRLEPVASPFHEDEPLDFLYEVVCTPIKNSLPQLLSRVVNP